MLGLGTSPWRDLAASLARALGVAGLLATQTLSAGDAGCCTSTQPTYIQGGGCCDKIFQDAAERLKHLHPCVCSTAAAPVCSVPACAAPADSCGTGGCGATDGCAATGGGDDAPFALIDLFKDDCGNNSLKDNGWVLGGHTQFGYQNNPDGAFTGNGPFLNQREWNRFALNQQYLYLGKVADGKDGLGFGFRADLMFGLDGNEGQSFGNINPGRFDYLNGWDHGSYEWAMPQLYAEMAYQDLSVKIGHFYTLMGYEVVPSNGNFFLSRQLTFYNSEPFTHTGVMTSYKVDDKLTVHNCWVLGMDTGFYQYQNGNAYHGGATYVMDDKTTFIYTVVAGNLGWRGNGAINSVVLTRKWADKFSTAHQFDVLGTDLRDGAGVPVDFVNNGFIARDSIGWINYAFYDLTDKVKAGVRQEWYKADSVSYNTITYGVNVKPMQNLVIRPEVRHMWAPGNNTVYTGSGYSDELFNQTVFGIDAILTY